MISGIDVVEAPSTAPAAPPQRHLALGLGGRVQPFAEKYGYEHLMDFTKAQLRRELIGRLEHTRCPVCWIAPPSTTRTTT
ncbi:hypothetical protein GCM10022224_055480 [Nonomuraea antimicrobica]|uniref:Uncharacterized protein n=1 Tax=Nonomuraea antimicrobica TaxID=561173 RepID=A0ABP7CBS2_9ACTN